MSSYVRHSSELLDNFRSDAQQVRARARHARQPAPALHLRIARSRPSPHSGTDPDPAPWSDLGPVSLVCATVIASRLLRVQPAAQVHRRPRDGPPAAQARANARRKRDGGAAGPAAQAAQ
eukprot:3830862-Prymnesium_polylepis.2